MPVCSQKSVTNASCPQNTVVVERWWQVPLSKRGSPPRLHPRRHRIYKLVEDTTQAPREKMELILTQTVPSKWPHNHFENHEVVRAPLLNVSLHHGTYCCLMSDFLVDRAWRTRWHCVCEKVHWQKQASSSRPCSVSIARQQTDICRGVKSV